MASPKQSRGAGPPDPTDTAALQLKMTFCGEREEAVTMGPAAHVATGGLRCKAILVLAICLSATALLYGLGSLGALPGAPLGSLPPSRAGPGLPISQRGAGDNLVATHGDPLDDPVVQRRGRMLMGSASTPGVEGDVSCGTGVMGRSLGTPTAATASPLAAQSSPRWWHGEKLGLGTAVMLSPAQRLGTGVPATSARLLQTMGDQTLGASPDHRTTLCRVDLSPAARSNPPDVVTASDLSSLSVPAPDPSTASGFSGVQDGASGAGVTTRSCNGQKEEVRPSPGLLGGEDHTTAPQPVPLPGVSSALPSERTSSLTETHPSTVWAPSAVTPEMLWETRPAGIFLRGKAALLVGTVLVEVLGNGSGLLATALASSPSAAATHGVNHPQVLAPFLPTAESKGPAVTLEKPSDLSSPPAQQALLISTKARPSSALTSAAGPAGTGVSLAAPDAIPELGATKAPCKDGAAMVASPSPRAAGVTHASLLGSPTQRPSLHPDPFLTTASEDAPTAGQHQAMKVVEMSMLPGQEAVAEDDGHSKPRTASAGPTAAPAGPPGPTHASPGSASPPSPRNSALEHCSEAVHHTSATSLPSPSYVLTSPGAAHAASSPLSSQTLVVPAGVMPDAQSMSSYSVTSQHPSTAREHLPAAAGEAFTPAKLMTMGKPGSPGVKPSGLPTPAQPVHVLPLRFRLLGIAYTEALSNKSSGSYRELEEEVMLMLNQMLSTYETFLRANVLEFMNGSVVVQGEVLFRGDAPAPTHSHLIRTVVMEARRGRSIFTWQLEPQSVRSSGFSLENLDPEKLSISLAVLQVGRGRTDLLQRLISKVTWSLSALYHVRNFTITQLRNLTGNLEITGDIYLDTIVHADVAEVLQALTALATCSVDLTSLSVEGAKLHLQVYPLSFLITNRRFSEDLLDPLAAENQELSRDLGDAVARALRDHRSFLQVMIRGFLPGSLICHGDVVFQHPAPTSLEVLEALVLSVGPNKALAGSDFQVDPYSLAVGEDTLEPPPPEPGFPEYGVAIMVICSLCIITAPIILLVYLRTKRLGWRDVVVLWDRRDPEAGTQALEMDNQGFWASSEQDPEDAHTSWQNDSA